MEGRNPQEEDAGSSKRLLLTLSDQITGSGALSRVVEGVARELEEFGLEF